MDTFKVTDMPALTTKAQGQLTTLETTYHGILSGHCHGHNTIFDPKGALEKIRTFATVFYDFFYSFYSQFPAYSEHWRMASEMRSLERISVWINNFSATRDWVDAEIFHTIKVTIINHAKASQALQRIRPVLDSPKVPVLGGSAPDSPLLAMAKSFKFSDPVASQRQAFVQPLLDERGWSLYDWAKEAGVSHHTASDYFKNKRKTQPYNRKKLAEALSVQYQQFPK